MKFISEKGLLELKNYQYKSGGYSYLDNKMNPFWLYVVELLPLWLAPNLVTFIGFAIMILASVVQVSYDVTLTQEIPRWTFLLMAFAIFAYQTLDAVDGKQARRTKSSSPLGQLFDHGCDSFILTFFIVGIAQATKMDKDQLFYLFLLCQISLWGLNQKEYHTGILHTHLNNFGVTELQLIAVSVQLISFMFGQDAWHFKFFGYEMYKLVCNAVLLLAIISDIYVFISNIYLAKNHLAAFMEWTPLFLFWGLEFVWFNSKIYSLLAGPILIIFGVLISLIACKIIICSTTRDTPPLVHIEMIPFLISSILLLIFELDKDTSILLFRLSFIATLAMSVKFLFGVIVQITNYLNIYCFKIKK